MKNLKSLVTFIMLTLFVTTIGANPISNLNETEIEDGRASDCVRMARSVVLTMAEGVGDDPNGENFQGWLALYNHLYLACYNS